MYHHLRGTLESRQPTEAVVDVGGVGYLLTIPLSSFEALPSQGEPVTLYTHLHVREDTQRLYGFATTDERLFFRRLLEVTGIGPAVALSILSSGSYADFRTAIVTEEIGLLTRMKGVGKKTAQRMVLELKDALEKESEPVPATNRPDLRGLREDALAALVTLGFTRGAAAKEVDRLLSKATGTPDLGDIVRGALR